LGDLLEKHLYDAGVLTLTLLGKRSALAGPILEDALSFLRKEARIEVRGPAGDENSLRYALTERGRASAQAALARSGYIGPAPVPLDLYTQIVRTQSVRDRLVTRDRMHAAFADVVLDAATVPSTLAESVRFVTVTNALGIPLPIRAVFPLDL